ncbi:MAG: Tex-like N-terminal domain-containing protein, partial [Desulfomonilia bacterium]
MSESSESHYLAIARELGIRPQQVSSAAGLLAEGATVPFIARYRKELTGSLDEVVVAAIRERLSELKALDMRREAVIRSLTEQGVLTEDLSAAVNGARTLPELEDIYLPYRPKRRTRAIMAREKGLAPLADVLFRQEIGTDPQAEAKAFVDPEKGVENVEQALAGARDIVAERIAEDAEVRAALRALFEKEAQLRSEVYTGAEEDAATYRDYFNWQEKAAAAPSHRILAIFRGNREALLKISLRPPQDRALAVLAGMVLQGKCPCAEQVALAAEDSYKRLLTPSLENEMKAALKERADHGAIAVFARNLRELLMAPPLGGRRVLAIDPGYRTGGKVVCLDAQGALLHHDVIYPAASSEKKIEEAGRTLKSLAKRFG